MTVVVPMICFDEREINWSKKKKLGKKGATSPAEASEMATKHSRAYLELVQSRFTLTDFMKP